MQLPLKKPPARRPGCSSPSRSSCTDRRSRRRRRPRGSISSARSVENIVDELERLEERALQIGEDYDEAIDTKSQLDGEIADAEARIAEQEAELGQLRASLSEMALRSFVGGGAVPLGPLFEDSANLNDARQA